MGSSNRSSQVPGRQLPRHTSGLSVRHLPILSLSTSTSIIIITNIALFGRLAYNFVIVFSFCGPLSFASSCLQIRSLPPSIVFNRLQLAFDWPSIIITTAAAITSSILTVAHPGSSWPSVWTCFSSAFLPLRARRLVPTWHLSSHQSKPVVRVQARTFWLTSVICDRCFSAFLAAQLIRWTRQSTTISIFHSLTTVRL